jgi:nucleoside phosphorylase
MNASMLKNWCEFVDRYLGECQVPDRPLADVTVRVRHSRRTPYCEIGRALEEALSKYGAEIKSIEDLSFELAGELGKVRLAGIDAFIMIAATTGASAEALELAHAKSESDPPLRDRLYVAMPKAYNDGFIRKRLVYHEVFLDLYEDIDLERGVVCARVVDKLLERKRKEETLERARASEFNPKIGIVTALSIEYEAITSLLEKPRIQRIRNLGGAYQEYTHGTVPAYGGGEHEVVIARVDVGNNISSAMTERLFRTFMLDEVFVVGIAGGIPRVKVGDPDVRFGDVVVSGRAGVIQYDMVKQRPGHEEPHHPPRPPSAVWLNRAQTLIHTATEMDAFNRRLSNATGSTKFKRPPRKTDKLFDDSDPENPKLIKRPRRKMSQSFAYEGPIGSANRVVKSHCEREDIRNKHKVLAVEMEGSGVADAAMANGKFFFIIRGVCDYANTGKNDVWHPFAAMSAAVFAVTLIESMPLPVPE